ncbi:MAG: methyltransferase domain-containing protein [Acidobacteria bacterium]|nr:methyltransferase domain-containing protein [Acidobacteriota bacterium]
MLTSKIENPQMFEEWIAALETRHLADLRLQEVTRALRALSAAYVGRRGTGVRGTLDSAGKRAAFALFYAPLHFLAAHLVVRALGAEAPPPRTIVDIGCGTGAAAAAWALASGGAPSVAGIDRHPWAVAEANWTYRRLGLRGRARQGDVARLPPLAAGSAAIAAYVLNELPEPVRTRVEARLMDAAARGTRVLIIEPIARRVSPWWEQVASRMEAAGGRTDEWRFAVDLPEALERLDRAAGLDHRELTARSLYCPGRAG